MVLATIDGVPAPESPCARVFVENGFVARQGALVRLAGEGNGSARLGARPRPALTKEGFKQDDMWPEDEDDLAEMEEDLAEIE